MEKKYLYSIFKCLFVQHKKKVYTLIATLSISLSLLWVGMRYYSAKVVEIGSKESELMTLCSILDKKQEQLQKARSNEDSVQSYLLAWSPYFIKDCTSVRILEKIVNLANKQGLEVTKQSASQTHIKGSYDMANISLSLIGNLKDIIAWMSTSEVQLPLIHINHLEINERANALILDLELQHPLIR